MSAHCTHDDVVPVFPIHFEGWRTEITGTCAACGMTDFVLWEAYGYREAFAERPRPLDFEVLDDLDDYWWALGRFGRAAILLPPETP